jgi:hypothetical protein
MRLTSDELKLLSNFVLLTPLQRNETLWQAIRDRYVSAQLIHAYRAVNEVI